MNDPTILLVDDDDDHAAAVGAFLDAHGYGVLRAHSAAEGIALARAERPALVLLDVMMEDATAGLRALDELRRLPELQAMPIVVVSSIYGAIPGFRISANPDWLQHDGFLAKPVDLDALLALVRSRLALAALEVAP
jgi:twitching motility two-component system response regulator PilH